MRSHLPTGFRGHSRSITRQRELRVQTRPGSTDVAHMNNHSTEEMTIVCWRIDGLKALTRSHLVAQATGSIPFSHNLMFSH